MFLFIDTHLTLQSKTTQWQLLQQLKIKAAHGTIVVENIQIATILISVEMGDVTVVASLGNILLFKEINHLYYMLQLKVIVSHGFASMSTAAILLSQTRESCLILTEWKNLDRIKGRGCSGIDVPEAGW